VDPNDLQEVKEYQAFYEFIETIREGTAASGVVEKIMPFGVVVDLSYPYLGLIDIGHSPFNGGERLPHDFADKKSR
jgi:ribosomal protein S1